MKRKSFRLADRWRSFGFAFAGVGTLLRTQHNAWIHAAATVGVVAAGFYFEISHGAWCALILAIVMVWVAEAFNTAIEFLADAVSPGFHPLIKQAKDAAAAAVLLAAIGAVILGLLVFVPPIMARLRGGIA